MKRRRFIQTAAAIPATTVTASAQQAATDSAAPLNFTLADDAAQPVRSFFSEIRFSALSRLARLAVPAQGDLPNAADCAAPEFLDFLIGQSSAERQDLYTIGLDALNAASQRDHGKNFADTTDSEADTVLEPLSRAWSYSPKDPLERFLRVALRDLTRARDNSREAALATGDIRTVRWLAPLA